MKEIEVIKKAVKRRHPCDEVHGAIDRVESMLSERLTCEDATNLCEALDLTSDFFDESNEEYILMRQNNVGLMEAMSTLFTIACED